MRSFFFLAAAMARSINSDISAGMMARQPEILRSSPPNGTAFGAPFAQDDELVRGSEPHYPHSEAWKLTG
jgi:hypothetical protein